MTKETFIKELDKILKQATINEELDKIIDKIDYEEKWLIDIKMDCGFISLSDIRIAMCGIRQVVTELKGEEDVVKSNV